MLLLNVFHVKCTMKAIAAREFPNDFYICHLNLLLDPYYKVNEFFIFLSYPVSLTQKRSGVKPGTRVCVAPVSCKY